MASRSQGIVPIAVAAMLWGTTGTAAHLLPDEISPLATGSATMAIGGIALFAASAAGAIRVLRDRRSVGWLLTGAVGVFVYPLAFYSSMHLAGVAIGTVVSLGAAPVFAAVLEFVVDAQRVTRRWVLSAAVAVCGLALLALSGSSGPGGRMQIGGVLLGLLAAFSYALYTFASARVMGENHSSRAVMGALFGAGAVLLAPVLVLTGAALLGSTASLAITAYLAIGPMFLAYLLFGAGLRYVRGSTATVVTLLEPVVATVLAVTVVGERLTPTGWAGLAFVTAGILLLVLPARDAPDAGGEPLGEGPRL
ncbi:EamA family transporter [Rathayibacter sp. YIM 133350]|uniref:DMT family transporter n=1 Tax=Rathayibacter sp. YIM 133350 TaxID=3131992 RepID=UPI00307E4D49